MGAGDTLIEDIETQLREAVPQINSVMSALKKAADAAIHPGCSY